MSSDGGLGIESVKLLVVEDEALIRLGLASDLESASYEVVEAANATEAIAILEVDTGIRLVITDVDMPGGMDGVRLARYVRERWPLIQIILVSGKYNVNLDALPSGSKFVSKPHEPGEMIALVQSLMQAKAGGFDPGWPNPSV
jgi:CheY-like chemotaxis protein